MMETRALEDAQTFQVNPVTRVTQNHGDRLWGDKARKLFLKTSGIVLGKLMDWRRKRATAILEHELSLILQIANGHIAKGKPRGSEVFMNLEAQSRAKIRTFCQKWNVSSESIYAQLPMLADLHLYTIPMRTIPKVAVAAAAFVTTIVSLFTIGLASGLVNVGYAWITHLFLHRH